MLRFHNAALATGCRKIAHLLRYRHSRDALNTHRFPMYAARLQTLRRIIAEAGLDAIALMPGRSLIYMTGQHFHLMERPTLAIFPREGDPVVILPLLEIQKFAQPPYPLQTFVYDDADGPEDAFAAGLAAAGLAGKRLGVEGMILRFVELQLLQRHAPGIVLEDATEPLAALRLCKTAPEVDALRRAIRISQDALSATVAAVRPGMTERLIANRLMIAMLEREGGALAFDPAVQGGANSALPHGSPGDYALTEGDLLLFDFGTIVDDYGSDITRTFVLGELRNAQLQDAYAAVLAANEAGRKAAGPGVPAQEVDRAARARSRRPGSGNTSATGPGTAWAWTSTSRPTSARAMPCRWPWATSSRWSRASTCRTWAASASGRRPDHARRGRIADNLPPRVAVDRGLADAGGGTPPGRQTAYETGRSIDPPCRPPQAHRAAPWPPGEQHHRPGRQHPA